jgi:hypothetical protein
MLLPAYTLVAQSITLNMFKSDVTCAGMTNGNAGVEVIGGTEPFTYLWSTGAETSTIGNLGPGIYTVTVTDSDGEVLNDGVSLDELGPLEINLVTTDGTCGDLGTIQAFVTGGIGPFQYIWSNGKIETEIRDLEQGEYSVTVSDRGSCHTSESVSVNVFGDGLKLEGTFTRPSCVGATDGSISATQTGGQMPVNFMWSDGTITTSIDNLAAGTYSVSAVDAFGCTDGFVILLEDPDELIVEVINQNNSLFAKVEGGNPSYEYKWSNGVTGSAVISNLETGEYFLTVTDSNGCSSDGVGEILGPLSANTISQIESFSMFPSMVQNELQVRLQLKQSEKLSFDIYTLHGQLISSQKINGQIINLNINNVSNLQGGLYLMRISSDSGWSFIEKFIKQ